MRSVVRIYPGPPTNFRLPIADLIALGDAWELATFDFGAGWSSPVARWAHNPKVAGSNPAPATISIADFQLPIGVVL